MSRLVVVGDALLDRDVDGEVERLCPDAPVPVVERPVERLRPGGAGLAATLAAGDGHEVVLVAAVGNDQAGDELRRALSAAGVELIDLGLRGTTPEKVRVRGGGLPLLRLDRGGEERGAVGPASPAAGRAIEAADAVLVSDYGRGVAHEPGVRAALAAAPHRPLVWDPHPRGAPPVPGAALATPNAREAEHFASGESAAARARELLGRWSARAVCVTLGAQGALLLEGAGAPLAVPAEPARGGDTCGAGDRFASCVAGLLAAGDGAREAVEGAVDAAAAFVGQGGATTVTGKEPGETPNLSPPLSLPPQTAEAVIERTRSRGGTVVATGGCFDLLHAGHVRMLRAARGLGDCLVVCLNSDASVRRLKGPGRPLVDEGSRVAVLEALESVDAVAVFGEPTPESLLRHLRPDVFAKGGDYAGVELPEARALREWGGEVVTLPYSVGLSTTRLIAQAGRHAA